MSEAPFALNANSYQFLANPAAYSKASGLKLPSLKRQFRTAAAILDRLGGCRGHDSQRGLLLADDVGLGKTTIGALVAWIVAAGGRAEHRVRILAPNEILRARWVDELCRHVDPLSRCASHLAVREKYLRDDEPKLLHGGNIEVTTHARLHAHKKRSFRCELLIVDEAHRAKGSGTAFAQALSQRSGEFQKILFLTATPFSINLDELTRMLGLLGRDDVREELAAYAAERALLTNGGDPRDAGQAADALYAAARRAVEAIAPCVIRHGVEHLAAGERKTFGPKPEPWASRMTEASDLDIEMLIRADRALAMTRSRSRRRTDAQCHVGIHELARRLDHARARGSARAADAPARTQHLERCATLMKSLREHPKMASAVADVCAVAEPPGGGAQEKVVVFCHHHATAQEFVAEICRTLQLQPAETMPAKTWRSAWVKALRWDSTEEGGRGERAAEFLCHAFVEWLCAPTIRRQVAAWLDKVPRDTDSLARVLKKAHVRRAGGRAPRIAEAARSLFQELARDVDARRALKRIWSWGDTSFLPGGGAPSRILALCNAPADSSGEVYFDGSAMVAMTIFNSAFGPDVLVTTDKYSEGIDLHGCCRHLLHYELDPSPIRIMQRNGRVRRVGSWAGMLGEPVRYGYPAFKGTRDEKLVHVIGQRLDCFDMLLGGVGGKVELEQDGDAWRAEVTDRASKSMLKLNRLLTVK